MPGIITTHPREKDDLGNYPIRMDGVTVAWGAARNDRHGSVPKFIARPHIEGRKPRPYDINDYGWYFSSVADMRERLPAVLAERG